MNMSNERKNRDQREKDEIDAQANVENTPTGARETQEESDVLGRDES